MTDVQKQTLLKSMTGEANAEILSTYLQLAAGKVLNRAYPFNPEITVVPDEYAMTQIEIAAYLLNKRGAEGETSHGENGVSRSYENGDIPSTLMRQITPKAASL